MGIRCTVSESINWVFVDDENPDDEILVLVFAPDDSEPVSLGYLKDGEWYGPSAVVVAWAEMPAGPPKLEVEES